MDLPRQTLDRRVFLKLSGVAACGGLMDWTLVNAMSRRTRDDRSETPDTITLFLCGDVMLGRGIDQILPHPGDPRLYEPAVGSATTYVELAERVNGLIPRAEDSAYVWGDALEALRRAAPDVRIINLETSITQSMEAVPKGINYKMNPDNIACLTAADIDCCVLANNHVLDWGTRGLLDTLQTLEEAGMSTAGAGRNARQAEAPAVLEISGKGRLLVFAFGSVTSGIPRSWAAESGAPGVNLLPDLSERTALRVADRVQAAKRPGDVVVSSIHWGGNWGYEIPRSQREFAHLLIDRAGVDVIYGHSSHHPKSIEVYRDRPILYGCGDFLNDYEGIAGYEAFRDDLVLMFFLTMQASHGTLTRLTMVPLQIRNFRLNRASPADAAWLRDTLNREGGKFGTRVRLEADNALTLAWA